jgi:hypothetical protein
MTGSWNSYWSRAGGSGSSSEAPAKRGAVLLTFDHAPIGVALVSLHPDTVGQYPAGESGVLQPCGP